MQFFTLWILIRIAANVNSGSGIWIQFKTNADQHHCLKTLLPGPVMNMAKMVSQRYLNEQFKVH